MTLKALSTILVAGLCIGCSSQFQPPTRLTAGGVPVRVDSPGYAAPCWADVDGDGKKDLLVGQYDGGMIRVYKNLGEGNLATEQWLMADGAPAEVPGIW
ncbi:MAG: FG-GAP-like repeat-containing protein [Isosphaeraceae bacterium]